MKKILLLPSLFLPIPCVKGGAVEQLITYLLEINESYENVKFIVISKFDSEAADTKYRNTSVYYFDEQNTSVHHLPLFCIRYCLYKLFCKLFCNRISKHIFKINHEPLNMYQYFCRYIAKKEKVDSICIEGQWEVPFLHLRDIVGKENLFTHLHAVRDEQISLRRELPNSISISQYVHDNWVKDKSIVGRNPILLNAANIDAFNIIITQEDRNVSRKLLGVEQNELLLLFCGRIIPVKGIRELLDAFDLLVDMPIKLLLIGSDSFGNSSNTEFENEIMQRISSDKRIIPLGFVRNDKLPHYYSLADIQIIPTTCQEGAGMVAIEGMAAGLPLITTVSGGLVEYVNDEVAIQLPIDKNLYLNIANAIKHLHQNPNKRHNMGQAGKDRAKMFSKENYYKNFIEIFDN